MVPSWSNSVRSQYSACARYGWGCLMVIIVGISWMNQSCNNRGQWLLHHTVQWIIRKIAVFSMCPVWMKLIAVFLISWMNQSCDNRGQWLLHHTEQLTIRKTSASSVCPVWDKLITPTFKFAIFRVKVPHRSICQNHFRIYTRPRGPDSLSKKIFWTCDFLCKSPSPVYMLKPFWDQYPPHLGLSVTTFISCPMGLFYYE